MFNSPALETAKSCTSNGNNAYLASFDYLMKTESVVNPILGELPFKAATHGSDHPYILGDRITEKFNPTEEDFKVMEMMGTLVSNFVKYG